MKGAGKSGLLGESEGLPASKRMVLTAIMAWVFFADPTGARADETPVRVSPSRVMLGSLEFGQGPTKWMEKHVDLQGGGRKWRILKVDLSRAPGVEAALKKEEGMTRLLLRIDTAAFTDGLPFGSFVERVVRLETDLDDTPQILIPLTAFLSINRTKRNFSAFVFQGRERWQGAWGTPNVAGSILAVGCCLLGGFLSAVSCWSFSKKWIRFLFLGLGMVPLLVGFYFLALTFSRGAWIALFVGFLVLTSACRGGRWVPFLLAAIFLGFLLALPSAAQRLGSSVAVQEDKSAGNRLLVWKGALQMMGENPWVGVGADRFGITFREFYQGPQHRDEYPTAVNDYLTWGAERGLPVLILLAGIPLGLTIGVIRVAWRRRDIWVWTLVASLSVLMVASWFSTLWFIREWQFFYFGVQGMMVVYLVRKAGGPRNLLEPGLCLAAGMGAVAVFFILLSLFSLRDLPTRSSMFLLPGTETRFSCFEPRHQRILGTLVYLQDRDEENTELSRTILRPLAARGWRVLFGEKLPEAEQVMCFMPALTQHFSGGSFFAVGNREGGEVAWKLCADPRGLFQGGAGFGFDLAKVAGEERKPFFIFHPLFDLKVSVNPVLIRQRNRAKADSTLCLKAFPGTWPESRETWVEEVDVFFSPKAGVAKEKFGFE